MIGDYISWHYGEGLRGLFLFWRVYVLYLVHYFSISLLFHNLFAPWRRVVEDTPDIFPLGRYLEHVTFNGVSRVIGAMVRTAAIILGISCVLFALLMGPLALLIWIFIPIISLPLYTSSHRLSILDTAKKHCQTCKELTTYLFSTDAGIFLFARLHIPSTTIQSLVESSYDAALPEEWMNISNLPDLFSLLFQTYEPLISFMEHHHISHVDINDIVGWFLRLDEKRKKYHTWWNPEVMMRTPGIGTTWQYGFTPLLDQFTYALSSTSNPLGTLHGREKETHLLEIELSKFMQNNVCVVGENGVGRHAVIEHFADVVRMGYTLPPLRWKKVLELDMDRILSEEHLGTDLLLSIFREAQRAGNSILVIDGIDRYTTPGATPNISGMIAKTLESGTIQVIGVTTADGFEKCIKPNTHLMNHFVKLEIHEPNPEEMLQIMEDVVPKIEYARGVWFTYLAVKELIKASGALYPTTPFPQKAIDALDLVTTHVQGKLKQAILPSLVDKILSYETGIPYGEIEGREKETLLSLEAKIHERVIGQDEAIGTLAKALRRSRLQLDKRHKPIGSFLFLGPTGVGKTETAKALARVYFGDEKNMIRLDMSEFQDDESIKRLIGSPETNDPGILVSAIREHPFAVLLLDEFEKASKKIQNIFLTIFDEGYLTDAYGKRAVFSNTIVIATSNAGDEFIREQLMNGEKQEDVTALLIEMILKEHIFSPELLNRFDKVVVFKPLSEEDLQKIARLLLEELDSEVYKVHHIHVEITDELIDRIVQKSYNPSFGAREMQRVIHEDVEDEIAKEILSSPSSRPSPQTSGEISEF